MIWAKILLVVFCSIPRQNVFGQPNCCPENVTLSSSLLSQCENAEPTSVSCDKTLLKLPNSLYTIQNDTEGEYLDIGYIDFIVRSPYFCIGQHGLEGTVAIYCPTQIETSTETEYEYEEFSTIEEILAYFSIAVKILDFLSCLCMAFMAAWFFMSPAGMEEKLLFHLSLSLSLAHAFYFYNFVSSYGLLPRFCHAIMYLTFFFMLATVTWFIIILYYLWLKYKFDSNSFVIQNYQVIGYGVPTLVIVSGSIHMFIKKLVHSTDLKLSCSTFRQILAEFYVHPFIVAISLLNIFLWCYLRRRMKNLIIITPENERLQLKMNELLTLTGRLQIVLGLPWMALFLCDLTNEITVFRYEFLLYISSFLDMATSGDGILVFIVMVSSHSGLKLWVVQKICSITRKQRFQKSVPTGGQEFSSNPESNHYQMEPTSGDRTC